MAGIPANNIGSFAGEGGRQVNSKLIQPFNASLQGVWKAVRPEQLGEQLLGPVTIRLQIEALFPTGG